MRLQKFHVLGVTVGGGLIVLAVLGAALEWWWLVVLAVMTLLTAVLLVALDTDRRVRELRSFVKTQVATIDTTGGRAAPSQEDVVGTVRALQAQYTGRLDRMQESIDQAVAVVRAEGRAVPPPGGHADEQA